MEFKIEKDKKIPSIHGKEKYPLKDMEIGDSFFIPGKTSGSMSMIFKRIPDKKFTCRSLVEDQVKGIRVWRIK